MTKCGNARIETSPAMSLKSKTEALNYVIKFVYQGIQSLRPVLLDFDKVSQSALDTNLLASQA